MNTDDDEHALTAWQREIADVKPLSGPTRRADASQKPSPGHEARRLAAVQDIDNQNLNFLSDHGVPWLSPYEAFAYKRDGVQRGVFKKLKQGKYEIDAMLDLHQLSANEAREKVFEFIKQSQKNGVRTGLILHGKGARNRKQPAFLKSLSLYWLTQMKEVLAIHSAIREHGGNGAAYVLLQKNESAKRELREKFNTNN